MKLEKYNKNLNYSYTFGAFPTFELIKNKSEFILEVILSTKLKQTDEILNLINLCKQKNINIVYDDKIINKIADKENIFVVGVFKKYATNLVKNKNSLVLVHPADMGNMGTIMRTMLGFNFNNLIIVNPAVDYFNPKVIRASMGAIFSLNIQAFDSEQEYLTRKNKKYMFMLNGKNELGSFKFTTPCDLVFGAESSGLPDYFLNVDESTVIKHNNKIDSLNLPISVGIALYEFNKNLN